MSNHWSDSVGEQTAGGWDVERKGLYDTLRQQFIFLHIFKLPHLFVHTLNALLLFLPYMPFAHHLLQKTKTKAKTNKQKPMGYFPFFLFSQLNHSVNLAHENILSCIVLGFLNACKFYSLCQKIHSWKARMISYIFSWALSGLMDIWYTCQCIQDNIRFLQVLSI